MSVYLEEPKFLDAGESCIVVEFADQIDRGANDAVMNLKRRLEEQRSVRIVESLPTYRSLAVYFDPLLTKRERLMSALTGALASEASSADSAHRVISIPVCYGGEYGPDMETVSSYSGITAEEVIARHSGRVYHCYMIGFVPGFAYLGGMDESIATPRLQNPRTVIKGGSVGIAGKQTGIYPIDSPGGWQLIGRTPIRLFTPEASPPTLIEAGYGVRFYRISEDEYKAIRKQVESGRYRPDIKEAGRDGA